VRKWLRNKVILIFLGGVNPDAEVFFTLLRISK